MRFALVDDMAGARERVLRLLSDFCKQWGLTYTVDSFSSGEEFLDARDNFLLVSRGILVNLDYVTDFTEKECLLQNGASVPITLRRQKQLAQIWRNYAFAKLHRKSASSINP